jgi:hypothetical protein
MSRAAALALPGEDGFREHMNCHFRLTFKLCQGNVGEELSKWIVVCRSGSGV